MSFSKRSPFNNLPKSYPMTAERACQPRSNNDTYNVEFIRTFNRYLLDISARLGNVTLESNLLSFCCAALLIASVLIILGHLMVTMFNAICRTLGIFALVKRMFTFIENEFAAARGLLIIIALLSATLLFSSIMPMMALKTPFAVYTLLSLIVIFLAMILL